MKISLEDLIPGCEHFHWREVLYLSQWGIYAHPTKEQAENLSEVCQRLELIRGLFNLPISITSGLRPGVYNTLIKGAKNSAHKDGKAIDFVVNGYVGFSACNKVRDVILPHLEDFGLRMENLPISNWVHIDTREPGRGGRFFYP